ncbi:MAG: ribosome small subunit-dependent GTPase A [Ruminococcus sp.]|uniref:ribosome small subunit-dependent GTPase A n=1 Tax=Ruminococcus sp. TaxID=41978 RepID=UPI0025F746F5|nr:ribosome small subunit-dependent GTPase A [Ruminococcus sp.]MBR0530930.1 ribosome small subunit-dependent GTPase A [Ruminococcus sp.]
MTGIITKAIGGLYTVDASDGIYECNARGVFRKKKISPMCGDRVNFTSAGEGFVIEEILPRSSELIRPPLANLDLLVFVSSTVEPRPNTLLLDKFIAIAEFKGIRPVVVFTKVDKQSGAELAEIYRSAGIDVFECDNVTGEGSAEVKAMLQGKLSAFTGNTGVGKSSLLNNMFPELELATGEISKKLGRGRHTTRHVQLYKLEGGGYIADTPGFSSFDTNRYDIIFKDKLAGCFVEFADFTDKCRFPDCSHTKEKGCAVIEAVKAGEIPQSRFDSYVQMYEEAKQLKEWEYKND